MTVVSAMHVLQVKLQKLSARFFLLRCFINQVCLR